MEIKNIKELDINYFAEHRHKMFDYAWRGILPNSWLDKITFNTTLENIKRFVKNNYNLYMLFENNKPCGYIMFGNYRETKNKQDGEIMSIYFYNEYKGKGYAQTLFSFAENELIKTGHNKIYIWVLEINARARHFYEKNGYKLTGKTRIQDCDKPYIELEYSKTMN